MPPKQSGGVFYIAQKEKYSRAPRKQTTAPEREPLPNSNYPPRGSMASCPENQFNYIIYEIGQFGK